MKKNILCIVAHPDDEALGVGGSLIKHAEFGDTVNVIIFSALMFILGEFCII